MQNSRKWIEKAQIGQMAIVINETSLIHFCFTTKRKGDKRIKWWLLCPKGIGENVSENNQKAGEKTEMVEALFISFMHVKYACNHRA